MPNSPFATLKVTYYNTLGQVYWSVMSLKYVCEVEFDKPLLMSYGAPLLNLDWCSEYTFSGQAKERGGIISVKKGYTLLMKNHDKAYFTQYVTFKLVTMFYVLHTSLVS